VITGETPGPRKLLTALRVFAIEAMMIQPGFSRAARTFGFFKLAAVALLISATATAFGSPCDALKGKPDVWVDGQVNALVLAAHTWFERDSAERAYNLVIDRIANTVKKCALADDKNFRDRYPQFLDLVNTLALARRPDHELGFTVTDETYFAETRQYVEIPAFLLTPAFLRTVTRYETLPQAKAMLRQINAARSAADQLIFFSYESRHLGTPDNPNSFRRDN
jgi:hypothetical protein